MRTYLSYEVCEWKGKSGIKIFLTENAFLKNNPNYFIFVPFTSLKELKEIYEVVDTLEST